MPGPSPPTKKTRAARLAAVLLSLGLAACGTSSSTSTSTTTAAPNAGATTAGVLTTPTTGATAGRSPAGTTAATTTTGPATPAGRPLPRAELAAKAGAICSAATAAGRHLKVPSNLTSNAHAAAAYFDKAVPPLDAETRAFQALTPAPAAASQWEALLGAQVALDRLAEGYRQKAHAGQLTTLADVKQLITVGQTIADAAVRLGARCV